MKTSFGMIRRWNGGDVDALVKHADNRKIWLNLRDGFPHPYTAESARSFLAVVGRQNPVTFFAIATAEEAIGGIGVTLNRDVHRLTAEMGYWLGEAHWGKGIVSETIVRFSAYAFERFGLVRIYAEPYAENRASCRVLEKSGFALEGRMRSNVIKDGRILDQLLYAKIKSTTDEKN
jgi:RimJ/RimL family protein N-acetyltransferase